MIRTATPSRTKRFLCTFGLNERFVRRFEKLTLCPNVLVFPQTSHFPATAGLPFIDPRERARPEPARNPEFILHRVRRRAFVKIGRTVQLTGGRGHNDRLSYHSTFGTTIIRVAPSSHRSGMMRSPAPTRDFESGKDHLLDPDRDCHRQHRRLEPRGFGCPRGRGRSVRGQDRTGCVFRPGRHRCRRIHGALEHVGAPSDDL